MSRFIAFPKRPTANSRFKDLQAALKVTTARSPKSAAKPKSKASPAATTKTSTADSKRAAPRSIKVQTIKTPSAEELRLKQDQDARIDADIAAAMKRKEARDIQRMWARAIIKSNRTSIAHGSSLGDYERSIQHATAKPTGQAAVDAFWRGIHDNIEARGW